MSIKRHSNAFGDIVESASAHPAFNDCNYQRFSLFTVLCKINYLYIV